MSNLLSFDSRVLPHPENVNIKLKKHQLAMLQRCIDIENIKENMFGIMNDKPGTGKTYVILSLIHELKKETESGKSQTNIIVVPQNIYSQWIMSIEKFSSTLSYKKFINYENIISLYNDPKILIENDIILTTSSYYHIIATTLSSLDIKINRVFFDEIDSISNIICTQINANFIWFVSATFNKDYLGYYKNALEESNENNFDKIICRCDNNFIDENIFLEDPLKTYYLCKNIYIDHILGSIVSEKELLGLNAMDYTLHNKHFEKQKAYNEKDIIELILKNRKSIIDFDKFQIDDAKNKTTFFEEFKINKIINEEEFKNKILKLHTINDFKKNILDFL